MSCWNASSSSARLFMTMGKVDHRPLLQMAAAQLVPQQKPMLAPVSWWQMLDVTGEGGGWGAGSQWHQIPSSLSQSAPPLFSPWTYTSIIFLFSSCLLSDSPPPPLATVYTLSAQQHRHQWCGKRLGRKLFSCASILHFYQN